MSKKAQRQNTARNPTRPCDLERGLERAGQQLLAECAGVLLWTGRTPRNHPV